MEIQLADKTKIAPSPTLKTFEKLLALNDERVCTLRLEPIIDLTIGQPHMAMNPVVSAYIQQKLQGKGNGKSFGHSLIAGRPEALCTHAALCHQYYPGVTYSIQEVTCGNGANQALWKVLILNYLPIIYCEYRLRTERSVFSINCLILKCSE
jgi:aspartate aminotransferase